jgi:phage terminase large subunit-like protein
MTTPNALAWIAANCIYPGTGRPFVLYAEEKAFITRALTLTDDGRLPYPEQVYSAPKKSGKTALGAMMMLTVIVHLAGRGAEGYCLANDFDQAQGRVFDAVVRIVRASPKLADIAVITANKITFPTLGGSFIQAIASDYAGAAGSNPSFVVFDELWAFTTERANRLWDEMPTSPARKVSGRLTVSYAGFSGESALLEGLVKRGLQGHRLGSCLYYTADSLLMHHTHECLAPWQSKAWIEEQRASMRAPAFLRQIENRFVGSESPFIDIQWWDDAARAGVCSTWRDPSLDVCIGVDASVKHDSTALCVTTFDKAANKLRLVNHRIWQPSPDVPLDFEHTVEAALLDLQSRFRVKAVRYDPYQLANTAQRMERAGLPMQEYPQTPGNLTEAANNLYELLKSRALIAYPDAEIRLCLQRAIATESGRGWKIDKAKQSHKIDVVVALAMAAVGSVQGTGRRGEVSTSVIGPYSNMVTPLGGGRTNILSADRGGCIPSAEWTKKNSKSRVHTSLIRGMI